MQIDLPYGRETRSLEIPKDEGVDFLIPAPSPAVEDIEGAVIAAMRAPVNAAPLHDLATGDGEVVILVSDLTRAGGTEIVLPVCVGFLLDIGVKREAISVIIARGAHRKLTKSEREVFKMDALSGIRVEEHDCDDSARLSALLLTSRQTPVRINRALKDTSLVVIISPISFHYFAGFGGGRKLILPGCADRQSILANHRLSLVDTRPVTLHPGCRAGLLEGNPVHEDMCEALRAMRSVFTVNFFCSASGDLLFVNAGDPIESHALACDAYRRIHTCEIRDLYDVVVLSAGGHPHDLNLLQSHKALRQAAGAVREGGKILLVAECGEGVGSDSLEAALQMPRDKYLKSAFEHYDINNQAAVSLHDLTAKVEVAMVSAMNVDQLLACGIKPCVNAEAFLEEALGEKGRRVCVIANGRGMLPVKLGTGGVR